MEFLTFIIGIVLTLGLTAFLLKQKDFLRIFALAPFMFFVLFVYSLNSDPNIDIYTGQRFINGSNSTAVIVGNTTTTNTVNTYTDPEPITYTISPFVMTTLNVLTLVMVFIIALFGYRGIVAKPTKGAP